MLRVVRGDATAEEIAALLAVVAFRTPTTGIPDDGPVSADPEPQRRSRSGRVPTPSAGPAEGVWAARGPLLRGPHRPGPGAWHASGMPR
jgi:hypothetical protein